MIVDYRKLKLGKYEMPTLDGLCYPVLLYLEDGQIHQGREIRHSVADKINLPDDLRQKTYENTSNQNIIEDRVGWAFSEMTTAGLLNRPERGLYQITQLGQTILQEYGVQIDEKIIHKQKSYQDHHQELIKGSISDEVDVDNLSDISQLVSDLNEQIANQLLSSILDNDPSFFEDLVVELLSKMGYKGLNGFSEVTSYTNDGEIDGIINQDPLGTRTIYLQAKRYALNNVVQRPDIQKFHGALDEKNADRGVFITTSDFSKGAVEAAERLGIVLINGKKLTSLMIKYSVGVKEKNRFVIYEIDQDYFE